MAKYLRVFEGEVTIVGLVKKWYSARFISASRTVKSKKSISVSRRIVQAAAPPASANTVTTTTLRRINTSPVITTTAEASRPIIPIVRSVYNAPAADGAWDYSFESGNGIKQQAQGSLRSLGDTQVSSHQ